MTPTEKKVAEQVVDDYIRDVLSITPTDLTAARKAAFKVYEEMGSQPPPFVLHVQSPFAATIAGLMLDRAAEVSFPLHDRAAYLANLDAVASNLTISLQQAGNARAEEIVHDITDQVSCQVSMEGAMAQRLFQPASFTSFGLRVAMGNKDGLVEWKERTVTLKEALRSRLRKKNSSLPSWRLRFGDGIAAIGWPVDRVCTGMERSVEAAIVAGIPKDIRGSYMCSKRLGVLMDVSQAAITRWCCNGAVKRGKLRSPMLFDAIECLVRECSAIYWDTGVVVTCDQPVEIHLDEQQRLHRLDGPALRYRDGWEVYAIHGAVVPALVVMDPASTTAEQIDQERNVEIRRVLVERYGINRYILESGADVIHHDVTGMLCRKLVEGDEPITMVRVLNATPEPDGSLSRNQAIAIFGEAAHAAMNSPLDARFKDYMIRVPPWMATAREAVAWTFGLDAEDYHPSLET